MAVRFDTSTDRYNAPTGIPTIPFTYTVWFLYNAIGTGGVWQRVVDTPTTVADENWGWQYLGVHADFNQIIYTREGQHTNIVASTAETWYRGAVVRTATEATVYAGSVGNPLTIIVQTYADRFPESLWIGGRGTEWFNGRVAAFKSWSVALTQDEVESELSQYRPLQLTNLVHFHPFFNAETTDYSGNNHHLTVGAGATATEDGPPIPWGSSRRQLILPASVGGGTPVTVTDRATAAATRPSDQTLIRSVTVTDRAVAAVVGYPTQTLVADRFFTDRAGGATAARSGQVIAVDTGPPVVLTDRPAALWATTAPSNLVTDTVLADRASAAAAGAPATTLAVDRTVMDRPIAARTAGGAELAVNTTSVTDRPGAVTAATPSQILLIEIIRLDRPGAVFARGMVSRRVGDLVLADYPAAIRAGHVAQGVTTGGVLTNWPPTVRGPFTEPLVTIQVGPRSPASQSSARCAGGDR